MKITYYGHSSFSVLAGNKHLLFDPYITGNDLAKHININDIKADYIFVSHGHFDHILDVVAIANNNGATVVGGFELYDYFSKQGVKNIQPLNPGGKVIYDFGTVKSVAAQHSSSFPDGSYAGTASGFVVKTNDGNFYYSGDTALTLDMTLIPKFATLDFAVFPIGDMLTMGVEEAIEAAQFVKTNKVLGVHYNTFGFIKIDKDEATKQFENAGLTLYLPEIGETIDI
ncbi:metal-dependent hydrolase [Mucilaginibacter aquaedulcis]|uniref:metal-dependent hydrolase n=1 Tax=Mucilaginibacter aquaedulcis TaxID=1187081 RepID=UPI0025B57AF5|nr:metal-dependent hydrolase [Mucilaginibacter aquaedulcis]MDN3549307.1 metal-dependent hydrolase [Mucilaginibacter aquaedulcis]